MSFCPKQKARPDKAWGTHASSLLSPLARGILQRGGARHRAALKLKVASLQEHRPYGAHFMLRQAAMLISNTSITDNVGIHYYGIISIYALTSPTTYVYT